jgi:hypothetical protein
MKTPSKTVISEQEINRIAAGARSEIASWVRAKAGERNVSISWRRPTDRFARAVSRLSDAETDFDEIEDLLVALSRSRVLTPYQRGLLQLRYLHLR